MKKFDTEEAAQRYLMNAKRLNTTSNNSLAISQRLEQHSKATRKVKRTPSKTFSQKSLRKQRVARQVSQALTRLRARTIAKAPQGEAAVRNALKREARRVHQQIYAHVEKLAFLKPTPQRKARRMRRLRRQLNIRVKLLQWEITVFFRHRHKMLAAGEAIEQKRTLPTTADDWFSPYLSPAEWISAISTAIAESRVGRATNKKKSKIAKARNHLWRLLRYNIDLPLHRKLELYGQCVKEFLNKVDTTAPDLRNEKTAYPSARFCQEWRDGAIAATLEHVKLTQSANEGEMLATAERVLITRLDQEVYLPNKRKKKLYQECLQQLRATVAAKNRQQQPFSVERPPQLDGKEAASGGDTPETEIIFL